MTREKGSGHHRRSRARTLALVGVIGAWFCVAWWLGTSAGKPPRQVEDGRNTDSEREQIGSSSHGVNDASPLQGTLVTLTAGTGRPSNRMIPCPRPSPVPRLVVVSTGGVGTSYFMQELERRLEGRYRVNQPDDADELKHGLPIPSYWRLAYHAHDLRCNSDAVGCTLDTYDCTVPIEHTCEYRSYPDRMIFLLPDNAAAAVKSHFIKRQTEMIFMKLRGFNHFNPKTADMVNVRIQTPQQAAAGEPGDIAWGLSFDYDDYVNAVMTHQRDLYGIGAHAFDWSQAVVPCPLMTISLAYAVAHPQVLADFLGVPVDSVADLRIKPRTTTNDDPEAYQRVYDELQERLTALEGRILPASPDFVREQCGH